MNKINMNKVAGIGIAVIVIAVVIVAAMSYSDDSGTTDTITTQVGPFTVESSQEISKEETAEGTDYSVLLTEKLGIKSP